MNKLVSSLKLWQFILVNVGIMLVFALVAKGVEKAKAKETSTTLGK